MSSNVGRKRVSHPTGNDFPKNNGIEWRGRRGSLLDRFSARTETSGSWSFDKDVTLKVVLATMK